MYETSECGCSEIANPMEVRHDPEKQISSRATELLGILCEIERMANRIDGTLFARLDGEKKCDPTPSCLAENIELALDEARVIAKTLDKIIQRL